MSDDWEISSPPSFYVEVIFVAEQSLRYDSLTFDTFNNFNQTIKGSDTMLPT
jgi:hypothetical protein